MDPNQIPGVLPLLPPEYRGLRQTAGGGQVDFQRETNSLGQGLRHGIYHPPRKESEISVVKLY